MIEYILESLICGAVLYVAYLGLLRKSRNYQANRWLLLCSVGFFLLVPLIDLSTPAALTQDLPFSENIPLGSLSALADQVVHEVEEIQLTEAEAKADVYMFIAYALITAILIGRFMYHLYVLHSYTRSSKKQEYKGSRIVLVDHPIGIFSFLRTIYVNERDWEEETIAHSLLLHELGHIRQRHSLDILLLEFLQAFLWFHPFVFLFKRAVKINHEYLADAFAVRSGADRKAYALKLIHYTSPHKPQHLGSGFSYSLTKNRLIMLAKYDKKGAILHRLALLGSLMLILFVSSAFSQLRSTAPLESGYVYADSLFWSGEDQKVYFRGNVVIKYGENDVKGTGSFSFLGSVNLLIVNGEPVSPNTRLTISGAKCNIRTLSPEDALAKYGNQGKWGAIEIETTY
ncbi:MAG: M56 family metallopeptidase [Bacteroidota bacterium]